MEQASETRFVVEVMLRAGTEKVNACFMLPEVATRIAHPDKALVVANCTLPEVVPAGIVRDPGIMNAVLLATSVTTVGEGAGTPRTMAQLPEVPGASTTGVQDRDIGLFTGAAAREMEAVKFVAPKPAVITAPWEAVIVAAETLNEAEAEFAGMVKVPGTVNNDGTLLETETVVGAGPALERVTKQVVLALEARLAAAH